MTRSLIPALTIATLLLCAPHDNQKVAQGQAASTRMQKRWLFFWRDMSDPKEVDRMIARFPAAKAEGYNGIAFSWNVPASKAAELRTGGQSGLALR